jgi:ERCC4-type nuclease
MLTVDDRVGSVELADCLRAMHVEVEVKRLSFADFAFDGHGPKGPCTIGVERKRLRDLLCCIQDSRFAAHQLPGLIETYDHCYLIVEGKWSVDPKTEELIEVCKDGWRPVRLGPSHDTRYCEVDNYLNSIATMSSCRVKTSTCPAETVMQLVDLYHWWQKSWSNHKSLKVLRKEPPKFSFFNPSTCQLMASCLPGVGYERSGAVAAKFRTPINMVLGTAAEWMEVAGIGQGIAAKVVKALTEEKGE